MLLGICLVWCYLIYICFTSIFFRPSNLQVVNLRYWDATSHDPLWNPSLLDRFKKAARLKIPEKSGVQKPGVQPIQNTSHGYLHGLIIFWYDSEILICKYDKHLRSWWNHHLGIKKKWAQSNSQGTFRLLSGILLLNAQFVLQTENKWNNWAILSPSIS